LRKLGDKKMRKITNYKIQITKGVAPPAYWESQITMSEITNKKLIKSFCGGPGGDFFKKSPLAAGGKMEARNVVLY
jgi:hypothetical protein